MDKDICYTDKILKAWYEDDLPEWLSVKIVKPFTIVLIDKTSDNVGAGVYTWDPIEGCSKHVRHLKKGEEYHEMVADSNFKLPDVSADQGVGNPVLIRTK